MEGEANILVVDDSVGLRKTFSFILKRKGYAVTMAADGQEAVNEVMQCAFDIIFMDIKMPGMNGIEAYKNIKKIRSDAAVVMMTAFPLEKLVQEALRIGALAVLLKPLNIDEVVGLIEWQRKVNLENDSLNNDH